MGRDKEVEKMMMMMDDVWRVRQKSESVQIKLEIKQMWTTTYGPKT